ncbi:MAG: hypothetical protein JEZ09_17770 [Salinivirgaceae bacterium]|nr:hypothetical protein [Salinivirgaceae bacterium]
MKKILLLFMSVSMLATSVLFTSCSKDEDNTEEEASGSINSLTASLSTYNGRNIYLTWENPGIPSYGFYSVYRAEGETGEFENLTSRCEGEHFNDIKTECENTYKYYITYSNMVSETITVKTGLKYQPYLNSCYAQVNGEAEDAVIQHIFMKWAVGETDDVDKYEIYCDGNLIYTETKSYETEFRDTESKNFDQEYTYKVVVITDDGQRYESFESTVTPHRPDAVNREVPEIIKVKSNLADKTVEIYLSDVSNSGLDLIGFYAELEGLNYYWEADTRVEDMSTDEEGNLILKLNADGATLPSGQTIWLKSKVRVHIDGGWSDWSDWNRSFVF